MLKAVLSAPSAPLPGTSLYYISLSLWFGDINTEIQMTMQRSSVGQSTHLSLAATDKGSILIQDNCWLSTGDQTSRLHISTDLLFPSLNWTHFDFGWAPAVSWKKWYSAHKGHPYPWSYPSVIAPVFSFCFSSEISQENLCCFSKDVFLIRPINSLAAFF